jgi:hypothetical protein
MCKETGVGSGTVWAEDRLFPDEDTALKAAQAQADAQNADPRSTAYRSQLETFELAAYQLRAVDDLPFKKLVERARDIVYNGGSVDQIARVLLDDEAYAEWKEEHDGTL